MANIEKRVSATGNVTYRVKVRLKGYEAQTATFDRLTDARKWEQDTESALRAGRHFKTKESKKRTISDLLDRYNAHMMKHNAKRHEDIKSMLVWWKAQLGHMTLVDVTKAILIEKRDYLLDTPKTNGAARNPATANRYMNALSNAFTLAVNDWEWLDNHPMQKISKLKESRGRVRFLNDEERTRLLAACEQSQNPYLLIIVVLALSTGARRGEILGLRWPDVDFDRKVIVLHDTKNKERRVLPMMERAYQLMRKHQKVRRIDTTLVFPSLEDPKKPQRIRAAWISALEAAEVDDFRFHDLRHSAASYLAMNGATLAEIAEVLGHKTLQMVKRYAHLTEQHTISVVSRMNKKIFG